MTNPRAPLATTTSRGIVLDLILPDTSGAAVLRAVRKEPWYERVPVILMQMRLLDERARFDQKLKSEIPSPFPDARPRLDLLGALRHQRHDRAAAIWDRLDEDCQRLAEALAAAEEAPEAVETLRVSTSGAVQRLAHSIPGRSGA